ncbi:MAG: hypothetical protein COV44_01685 [Deltaproteobacteria bacterium CG11_big_fil_rev_8_21_14_0_20_45_16]|nr:MAG: hypothetical protein COV44_01685 [Deltaproteobacteria bacterium CG11_big_fil_rev_8_21_14_0_20_45_16]
MINLGRCLKSWLLGLIILLYFPAVLAQDGNDAQNEDSVSTEELLAVFSFQHDISDEPRIPVEEINRRLNTSEFEIPEPLLELYLQLLTRIEELKAKIDPLTFKEEVQMNKIYTGRNGIGRAELTTLNGYFRIRVIDDNTQRSWFFFMKEEDRFDGGHETKIRDRQIIMAGTEKARAAHQRLSEAYEAEGLHWYNFFKRWRVRSDFKKQNYRALYLPGRDTSFAMLENNENGSQRIDAVEHYDRPFNKMFFGVGFPISPWWQHYKGALKAKLNWRLAGVCAAFQVTFTCGLGLANDGLHWSSVPVKAMLLSALFGGGIASFAGTYKEWARLGDPIRQWMKLMTVGFAFGYPFSLWVKYDGQLEAFRIFDSTGNLATTVTTASGAVIAAGVLAHASIALNNTINQFLKREIYELAYMRRRMRLDRGKFESGILKGSSRSDAMMQFFYNATYIAKIGDLGGLKLGGIPLGKIILLGSVPAVQLYKILFSSHQMQSAPIELRPEWREINKSLVKNWWRSTGIPFYPIKFAWDFTRNTPNTWGQRARGKCTQIFDGLAESTISPGVFRPPF